MLVYTTVPALHWKERCKGASAPERCRELGSDTGGKANAARENFLLQHLIFQLRALILELLTKMCPLRHDVSSREKLSRE